MDRLPLIRLVLVTGLVHGLITGCVGNAVGDPCTPEQVYEDGFDPTETYVESSSPQCATRVCLVRGLAGDPRPECTSNCATEHDVAEHVYCSCRCDDGAPSPCACPDGFTCAPAGASGSYCIREGAL